MRHRHSGRQLNRNSSHRQAMFRNMTSSLVEHEIIKTTLAKAKELRPYIEKMVTRAKTNSIFSRRILRSKLGADSEKLFKEIAPKYKDRSGGYTRITKLGHRESDGSPRAQIEFV